MSDKIVTVQFVSLERANNGQWMLQYSENNQTPTFIWVTDVLAAIILSAQQIARNEVRWTIKKALEAERTDGNRARA
jgi:hypothetical protein